MLFNSFSFAVFFPLVTAGYFALPHRWRWSWLLAASSAFYMAFVPAYILILCLTIAIDYTAGIAIERTQGRSRRAWLAASLAANVGLLAFFKYFDFASDNLAAAARWLHWNYPVHHLGLLLPIGLSFHTFQSMAYTIEVYRGRQPAERHLGILALYVLFYPQLVAGPIERPYNMLPQFRERHAFDYERAAAGLRLMAWGFFKKLVIADRLAHLVNPVYGSPGDYSGPMLLLATVGFAFQIYCDFSGYSDIAVGSAQVMGFRLTINFRRPYLAGSIGDFWRRWHVSLSTWFRDYLFPEDRPLGHSSWLRAATRRRLRHVRRVMITFLVSGFWHGANWTFVAWGVLHGLYLSAAVLTQPIRNRLAPAPATGWVAAVLRASRTVWTFSLVCFAWIFFRATDLAQARAIIGRMLTGYDAATLAQVPGQLNATLAIGWPIRLVSATHAGSTAALVLLLQLAVLLVVEAADEGGGDVLGRLAARPAWFRWATYYAVIANVLLFGVFEQSRFIYFQF
jgi:alginate O-acetyltransferase complex protein AlgI